MSEQPADLGARVADLGLPEGVSVYDPSGRRVGVVDRVQHDADIFEGLIIHTLPLPGRHVFADFDEIAELRERGVVLTVEGARLHPLDERPRRPRDDGEEVPEDPLERRLRHAWDRITGAR